MVTPARMCGLVLAAGAGTRFGGPKALARTADGTPWVARAVRMLRDAGCADVIVALGASAPEASLLVPDDARIIVVGEWAEGLGATLRAGLGAVFGRGGAGAGDGAGAEDAADAWDESGASGDGHAADEWDAVLVTPVDTPDATPEAAVRVVERAMASVSPSAEAASLSARAALARAVYSGAPGHPVCVGRDHWLRLSASLSGDSGAGRYLRSHSALEVECGDLWSGADIDHPAR